LKVGAYDANRYDVEFAEGQKVLWLAQNPKDKLYMKWFGPFVVVKKLNEVSDVIKDELDGETRPVSVQQIVPFYGDYDVSVEEDDRQEAADRLADLRYDKFVIFKRHDDKYVSTVHVGQVIQEYDPLDKSVVILHWVDLGKSGLDHKVHNSGRQKLEKRQLAIEMYDEEGVSYTKGRGTVPVVRQHGEEFTCAYFSHTMVEIMAKNFNLDANGRIPAEVLLQIRAYQEAKAKAQL